MPSTPEPAPTSNAGRAELRFARRDERTRLARSLTRPPLLVQRSLYLDECLPDMVTAYIANPTAGIFAGDRFRIDVTVEAGARVHLTTPAATKVFSMPAGCAAQETHLKVEPGGYLEYLPEPLVPFRDARFQQATTVEVAPGATAIIGDILTSGRAAHRESLAFASLSSRLTVVGSDGQPLYHEAFALAPAIGGPLGIGVFGDCATPVTGTLLVVTDAVPVAELLADVREELGPVVGVLAGATALPFGIGVGVKALAEDTPPVRGVMRAAWRAARRRLLGAGLPPHRKG